MFGSGFLGFTYASSYMQVSSFDCSSSFFWGKIESLAVGSIVVIAIFYKLSSVVDGFVL